MTDTVEPGDAPSTTSDPDTRRTLLVGGAVLLGAGVLAVPEIPRLDGLIPFAQGTAFRPALLVLFTLTAAVLLWRRIFVPALALLLIVCVAAPQVLTRTFGSVDAAGQGRELSVLVINAQTAATDTGEVAKLIKRHQPDVVSLPEGDRVYRETVEADGDLRSYHGHSAQTDESALSAVSVLIHERLGEVTATVDHRAKYPSWILSGGGLGGVRVVAYHASSPKQLDLSRWRDDLDVLSQWCSGRDQYLIAGSFNATLDHRRLREAMSGCTDSAKAVGEGLTATWPAVLPRWLGSQLEHVMFNGNLAIREFEFIDVPTSDHRGILARYVVS